MKHVYTCSCLLEHLTRLPYSEIMKCIACHDIFYLKDKWIMFLCDGLSFYFFCLDTCLDFMDFSGVNNCCSNCCISLIDVFKKYLIKVKK